MKNGESTTFSSQACHIEHLGTSQRQLLTASSYQSIRYNISEYFTSSKGSTPTDIKQNSVYIMIASWDDVVSDLNEKVLDKCILKALLFYVKRRELKILIECIF